MVGAAAAALAEKILFGRLHHDTKYVILTRAFDEHGTFAVSLRSFKS